MKKSLLIGIIISFVFVTSGIALAQELEKISSPDQIKNFKVIKKEGANLFGIRLGTKTSSTEQALEKILTPGDMKFFDKIKKVGTSLFGIRKKTDNKTNDKTDKKQTENKKPILVKPEAIQCVKNAIDKKDASLKTSITTHNQNILAFLDARNVCQKAALDKTTGQEQFEANKICVETHQKSMKESNDALQKARNESQKIYRGDLKACSVLQRVGSATSTSDVKANMELNEEIIINDGEDVPQEAK